MAIVFDTQAELEAFCKNFKLNKQSKPFGSKPSAATAAKSTATQPITATRPMTADIQDTSEETVSENLTGPEQAPQIQEAAPMDTWEVSQEDYLRLDS